MQFDDKLLAAAHSERMPYICPKCGRPNYLPKNFYELEEITELECVYCKYVADKTLFEQKAYQKTSQKHITLQNCYRILM